MKNYLDAGSVISEVVKDGRVTQVIQYFDKSQFSGSMIVEEEQ